MLDQLVVRGRQGPPGSAILGSVYGFLPVLNADAHGKGLGLHGHPLGQQAFEGIPGTVADGKNRLGARNLLPGGQHHPGEPVPVQRQPLHLAAKANLPSQTDDPPTQILDHLQQYVRAHVGLGIKKDILPRPRRHKLLQYPADSRIIDPGIQLSVGKSPGAPLTKLHIGMGVQFAGLPECLYLLVPGQRILSPLQYDGASPRQGQDQSGKHPGGTKADHHRPVLLRLCLRHPVAVHRGRTHPLAPAPFEDLVFAGLECRIHRIDHLDLRLFPGIDGPADNGQLLNFRSGDPQGFGRLVKQCSGLVLRSQGYIPNTYHLIPPALFPAKAPELQAHCRL